MPYPVKQKSASRPAINKEKPHVSPTSAKHPGRKQTVGKTLIIIGIVLIPVTLLAGYYYSQQTKVSFDFTRKLISKPNAAPIYAFHITLTNTGNKDIVIKNLDVIQGLNGDDLYDQYKWEYEGKTLKAKNTIQWDMEFGNKNLHLLSFRVRLTAANGKVYTSWRQPYQF
jgi:hypothetical protein